MTQAHTSVPAAGASVVVVQTGFLGDAILAGGMLHALVSPASGKGCGLVVRSEHAEIFEGHPDVGRLHRFDKRDPNGLVHLVGELREEAYDVALIPHRSFRSALAIRRAGIPRRIGFRGSEGGMLLTDRIEYRIADHEVERNAALVAAAGIPIGEVGRAPWLFVTDDERAHAGAGLAGAGPLVVLAPGSVWATKQWTPEGYVELARLLRERGAQVVVVGGPAEAELVRWVGDAAGVDPGSIHAGDLRLRELMALVALARCVVSNDSAPLHLAEGVGTPVVAMFGPTVPEFGFGPRAAASSVVEVAGLECRPCTIHGSSRCPIGTHACMTGISSADVIGRISLRR